MSDHSNTSNKRQEVKAGTNWINRTVGRIAHVTWVGRHSLQYEYIDDHEEQVDTIDWFTHHHTVLHRDKV